MPGKSSIGFSGFEKLTFLVENFENFENFRKNYKSIEETAPALRVIRAKPGWRFTARCHTEPRWIGVSLAPRRFMIMVDIFMFLVKFHIRSYWFVTFRSFILYWSWILCEFQLPSSTKPRLTTSRCLRQNVEKWWNFRFLRKFGLKTYGFGNLYLMISPWRKFKRVDYEWGDLLYEFPAETRLTVYRRLDMESNTKTVAKRARVEPRTQVHVTTKKLF